jgi:hypothetical protein
MELLQSLPLSGQHQSTQGSTTTTLTAALKPKFDLPISGEIITTGHTKTLPITFQLNFLIHHARTLQTTSNTQPWHYCSDWRAYLGLQPGVWGTPRWIRPGEGYELCRYCARHLYPPFKRPVPLPKGPQLLLPSCPPPPSVQQRTEGGRIAEGRAFTH